jgi:lysophospholipase L1-like esterase
LEASDSARERSITVSSFLKRLAAVAWLAALPALSHAADDPPALELRDGDRVVFGGDGFFEYDHERGYLETELTARFPDRDVRFRNLGRTGDTVWGDAWAGFDTAVQGFDRRRDLVLSLDPTVILISCGMNESFEGEAGLPRFVEGLNRMLDGFAPAKARIALVGPIVHETLPPPLPDPAAHNADLKRYREAMSAVAGERGLTFIDMAKHRIGDGTRPERVAPTPETIDGIHLNPFGYWEAATVLGEAAKPQGMPLWAVWISARTSPPVGAFNMAPLAGIEATPQGVRFRSVDARLPEPPAPEGVPEPLVAHDRTLKVEGIAPGDYRLRIDGEPFAEADVEAWDSGVVVGDCPERRQVEALRKAIVAKNRLLYYRLRPENETYLYGFRKHEQGQNAAEVPKFDPLVAEKDAEIARLRVPKPHVYELVRKEGE